MPVSFNTNRIENFLMALATESKIQFANMGVQEIIRCFKELERICNLTVESPLQLHDSHGGRHIICSVANVQDLSISGPITIKPNPVILPSPGPYRNYPIPAPPTSKLRIKTTGGP